MNHLPPGSTSIKPDQLDPWIKDPLGNAPMCTISPLQLPNFVSRGRAYPSHMTQNLVTVGAKLLSITWSLILGSSWSCLIKVGPVWRSTFRFMFLKWQLVCKFGRVERNFLWISCIFSCFCTLLKYCLLYFFSIIFDLKCAFYINYFLLPFSINVVLSLSYRAKSWGLDIEISWLSSYFILIFGVGKGLSHEHRYLITSQAISSVTVSEIFMILYDEVSNSNATTVLFTEIKSDNCMEK